MQILKKTIVFCSNEFFLFVKNILFFKKFFSTDEAEVLFLLPKIKSFE